MFGICDDLCRFVLFGGLCIFLIVVFLFFFFSSRRRHTRCLSDWSSDVCFSDLNVQNSVAPAAYDRFNSQRMITLTANISGADLGSVASQLTTAMKRAGAPPAKVNSEIRGQIVPFRQMFTGLEAGLLLAVVVIFLLLAANYQSWKLAFVVTSTAPAVIAGVAIALWVTRTTLNIQSFMGAIMAIGVAVANAILLVTFAERSRIGGKESDAAAVEGAHSRLRPI